MKSGLSLCVMLAVSLFPAVAFADDPRDPSMRNAAARARDSEETRRLNAQELARVRERDARGELGWRVASHEVDDFSAANAEYAARLENYQRARADYSRDRARYERDMAQWRRDVAACRDGDYSACDN